MPDRLMGLTEIAALLGLSRQGVHQLTKRRNDFPAPYTRLAMGYVWDADEVERWARETGRIAQFLGPIDVISAMLGGMAKFKIATSDGDINEYVGTYSVVTESGVLKVKPEKGNPFTLSPSAWLRVEKIVDADAPEGSGYRRLPR